MALDFSPQSYAALPDYYSKLSVETLIKTSVTGHSNVHDVV